MTTIPYSPTEIAALRAEVQIYGIKLSPDKAWTLLRKVGDRGLCVDALLLERRPEWLTEIVGKAK